MKDTTFKGIPELTDEQLGEINDCFSHYLFYRKIKVDTIGIAGVNEKKEVYECTCSHCGANYTRLVEKPYFMHNHETECPKCGFKVTAKSAGYGRKKLYQWIEVLMVCPESSDKIWLRGYYANKDYQEKLCPKLYIEESVRYLIKPREKAHCWRREYAFGPSQRLRWIEIKNPQEPFHGYMGYGADYYFLTKTRLNDTFLKYINFDAFSESYIDYYQSYCMYDYYQPAVRIPLIRFMCEFAQHPIMESLLKTGFGELVAAKIATRRQMSRFLDWSADKLFDFFKNFDKEEIDMIRNEDYQYACIKEFALFKRAYGRKDIGRYCTDKKRFGTSFNVFLQLVCGNKLRYTHSVNYITTQHTKAYSKQKFKNNWAILDIWKDYLQFAKTLGYDIKNEVITHPKDLMKSHNKAAKAVTFLQNKIAAEKAATLTEENIKKYSFEYGNLKIVVPQCPNEIINEGKMLKHCVGGYSDRHFNGKLTILFIRKKDNPDTPYVTMEVNGTRIVQVHGYKNDTVKPLSDEVKKFRDEFSRYIVDPDKYRKLKEKARKSA